MKKKKQDKRPHEEKENLDEQLRQSNQNEEVPYRDLVTKISQLESEIKLSESIKLELELKYKTIADEKYRIEERDKFANEKVNELEEKISNLQVDKNALEIKNKQLLERILHLETSNEEQTKQLFIKIKEFEERNKNDESNNLINKDTQLEAIEKYNKETSDKLLIMEKENAELAKKLWNAEEKLGNLEQEYQDYQDEQKKIIKNLRDQINVHEAVIQTSQHQDTKIDELQITIRQITSELDNEKKE